MRPLAVTLLSFVFALNLYAQQSQNHLIFDARGDSPAPLAVPTSLGSSTTPDGHTLSVNSQYLMRDGKPWIPVMGEFHFSRYPEAYWEEEILKMKASGVEVIATYIFWIHHEEIEGRFDWSGQRDLRRFTELCAKHGMLVYARVGPWAHGETRNGGLPDWVLKKSAVRENDPVYLDEVKRFYAQIGEQLHGLLWKDGGPVIGVQIENEYAANGPGQGREHLATLKKMAIDSGLDTPLYTVTGWDNAVVPEDLVLPVYGGYPDAPWNASAHQLPANELYAFRFSSRVTGDMGALGAKTEASEAHETKLRTTVPFLTAEVGGGLQDTYHRRVVLSPSDVAATIPVMIGSGANLLGYYMFQGGENPDGVKTTLQESQRSGYPTDVPVKSYDFQAPIGEFGEMHDQLAELKLFHYFLEDFGAQLASERAIEPSQKPSGPEDLGVLRVSARIAGKSGFLFVNNFVRGREMPARAGTQFEIQLPGQTLKIPAKPVTVPTNSYFIWPVNLDLDGVTLSYATAQPILKIQDHGETYVFFKAIAGVPAEFAVPYESRAAVDAQRGVRSEQDGLLKISDVEPGLSTAITLHGKGGVTHIVLLSSEEAKSLWRVKVGGKVQLAVTKAQIYSDGKKMVLRQIGNPAIDVALFPAETFSANPATVEASASNQTGLFQTLKLRQAERKLSVVVEQTRSIGKAPTPQFGPPLAWRKEPVTMSPDEESFSQAGEWKITLPPHALIGVSDLYLDVHYQGDQARLFEEGRLLTDNFFNGVTWRIGLKRFLRKTDARDFSLEVLPLSSEAALYFEPGKGPQFGSDGQAGALHSIKLLPEYEVDLSR